MGRGKQYDLQKMIDLYNKGYSNNQNSFQCGEDGIVQKIIWQNPSVYLYY